MKANITNNKKNTTMRKIVPAAGMLSISAVMLATSTYAWFTMSREVELKNIQMTATVPEDIQISLGAITDSSNTVKLASDTGVLTMKNNVATTPATDYDWSNIANVGAYYQFGRLIPASSTTGADIFFTPDAKGDGKTVKDDAKYYQADTTAKYKATSHAYTSAEKGDSLVGGTWDGYLKNTGWDTPNDDGYYIDIPVWFRTSSKDNVELTVSGYVIAGDTTTAKEPVSTITDGDVLKDAVRVAIINTDDTTKTNLIPLNKTAVYTGGESVIDYYNRSGQTGAVASVTGTNATYSAATTMTNETVSVTAATANQNGYGVACPYIVRVWLEGEDPDCWNGTAGQDWQICLKFTNPAGDAYPTNNP